MRLLLFLNNWGGWQVARQLRQLKENIVGLVIQPDSDQKFAAEIRQELNLPSECTWLGPQLRTPETLKNIQELEPDLGISAWFGFILKPELLALFTQGCINLHPALLPWNRGWHTNVWPILDGTPAGVTIHWIDPGVDTGDIIVQKQIPIEPTDTGGSLHMKLNVELVNLFSSSWPQIRAGQAPRVTQEHSKATVHRRSELTAFDCFELNQPFVVRDFLNLLRARTYPPYPSAYFQTKSNRVYVRVQFAKDERWGGRSQVLDLNAVQTADKILRVLAAPDGSAGTFMNGNHRIYARAQLLKKEELESGSTPAWMAKQQSDVAARRP